MDEITAEYSVAELTTPVELRLRPHLTVGCKTDLGRVRENNEDKFEFYFADDDGQLASKGHVFVVCDGMGGHAAGQIASEIAAKTFIDVYLNHPSQEIETALRSAVGAANRFVFDVQSTVPSRKGMGTTLSAIAVIQDRVFVAHVGDSRVYRLRNGELIQLTSDHTWVEEALRSGMIQPEEVSTHPYRHVLNRAIGTEPNVEVDVFAQDVREGDIYLLCSDGLINHVDDPTIGAILAANRPSRAAWQLVMAALTGGGSDNCTVVIVSADQLEPQ